MISLFKTMNKRELSEYFSKISKRRKTIAGGFKDPEVQKKAQQTRLKNKAKDVLPKEQLLQDSETGQE